MSEFGGLPDNPDEIYHNAMGHPGVVHQNVQRVQRINNNLKGVHLGGVIFLIVMVMIPIFIMMAVLLFSCAAGVAGGSVESRDVGYEMHHTPGPSMGSVPRNPSLPSCNACGGDGRVECDLCVNGKVGCDTCFGRGCPRCMNTGKVPCPRCGGLGYHVCSWCGGDGEFGN